MKWLGGPWRDPLQRRKRLSLILPWLAPLVATLISWPLVSRLPYANLSLIYLAGVLLTAFTTRVRPALVCALLSFFAYTLVHVEPQFRLLVIRLDDALTIALLMLVALVTGHLAASRSEKVLELEASQLWNRRQMALADSLAVCVDADQVLATLARHLEQELGRPVHAALRNARGDGLHPVTALPAAFEPRAEQAWQQAPAGSDIGRRYRDGLGVLYFYLHDRCEGLVLFESPAESSARERQRLDAFIQLTRMAWSRIQLAHSLQQETLIKEREQLRSALLSSISHDLRTPLATMIGSVSSLIELEDSLSDAEKQELLHNTLGEAQRLNGYIQKLLDMTKLGHGELQLERDWIGIDDILSVVLKRTQPLLGSTRLVLDVPPDLPLLYVHPTLIEQALFNVVENSLRFAPADSDVRIGVAIEDGQLHIDVQDRGPGIPPEAWQDIFDMFVSLSQGDHHPAGSGLGLAICQGIIGAHGGQASVLRSRPGDTVIRLSLPLSEPVQSPRSGDDTDSDH